MTRAHAWMFFGIGVVAGVVGMVLRDPALMVVGAGLIGLPVIARETTDELAKHALREQDGWIAVEGSKAEALIGPGVKSARIPAHRYARWMDDPAPVGALTRRYLDGKIDVDEYTKQMEALPWTPTDSSRRAATPQGFRYAHSVLPDGGATSTDASCSMEVFTQPHSGVTALLRSIDAGQIDAGRIEPGDTWRIESMMRYYAWCEEHRSMLSEWHEERRQFGLTSPCDTA